MYPFPAATPPRWPARRRVYESVPSSLLVPDAAIHSPSPPCVPALLSRLRRPLPFARGPSCGEPTKRNEVHRDQIFMREDDAVQPGSVQERPRAITRDLSAIAGVRGIGASPIGDGIEGRGYLWVDGGHYLERRREGAL